MSVFEMRLSTFLGIPKKKRIKLPEDVFDNEFERISIRYESLNKFEVQIVDWERCLRAVFGTHNDSPLPKMWRTRHSSLPSNDPTGLGLSLSQRCSKDIGGCMW